MADFFPAGAVMRYWTPICVILIHVESSSSDCEVDDVSISGGRPVIESVGSQILRENQHDLANLARHARHEKWTAWFRHKDCRGSWLVLAHVSKSHTRRRSVQVENLGFRKRLRIHFVVEKSTRKRR